MSVYVQSSGEFGAIAATLRVAKGFGRNPLFPLSIQEEWEYEVFEKRRKKPRSKEEFRQSFIVPFVFRLYLANVMSQRYTYWKEDTTQFVIPLPDISEGKILELPELLSELRSLSYNIVTNGGNSFLGWKDKEKLDELISDIKSELIRNDYQSI